MHASCILQSEYSPFPRGVYYMKCKGKAQAITHLSCPNHISCYDSHLFDSVCNNFTLKMKIQLFKKYHWVLVRETKTTSNNPSVRETSMQRVGYTGDEWAEKPNRGLWGHPEISKNRKPLPLPRQKDKNTRGQGTLSRCCNISWPVW